MDSVVVLTEGAKRYYKHRLFSRIDVVNNGRGKLKEPDISIDDQQLLSKIRQRYKTVIGTHAKISKIKSIDTIIEALPSLSDTCLVVVGDGPQVESLKQLAKLKLIDDRVYFLGYRRDIGSYFKYYDIYAMPSISEGLPIALIEAVASRCVACLTSDIDTFNEVFDDSEVMKFRLKDYNHFAERVVELADDKELSFRFIENSYKKYLDKYTDEKMALNYLKLYSKLLDECKKRKNI